MFVACVHVRVKLEHREAFLQASLENGRNTIQEPGALRFDVLQQQDDADRFLLYEVYRDAAGAAAHKETAHYRAWREAVAPWMAEDRATVKYTSHFPTDAAAWSATR